MLNHVASCTETARHASISVRTAQADRCGFDTRLLIDQVPLLRRRISAGQSVFRAGQAFRGVLLVHTGCFKITIASADGRERVTGFKLRGELLATESFGASLYSCEAVALEDGEVWELPRSTFEPALARLPALAQAFHNALAAELRQDREWLLTLGTLSAEQRVAALLLDLGARQRALGFSGTHFMLSMTRADMGSFLGLQLETVTRTLSSLHGRGLLEICRRDVRIVDRDALHALISDGAAQPLRLLAQKRPH